MNCSRRLWSWLLNVLRSVVRIEGSGPDLTYPVTSVLDMSCTSSTLSLLSQGSFAFSSTLLLAIYFLPFFLCHHDRQLSYLRSLRIRVGASVQHIVPRTSFCQPYMWDGVEILSSKT